jgi:hypothetical protein
MKRLLISMSILLIASLSLNLILVFTGSKEESQPATVEDIRLDRQEMALERLRKRSTVEDRVSLEKVVQEQGKAELNFLRELAVKEGAVKTTEVIDRLLASKDKQLEQIVSKIEERASRERSRRSGDFEQSRRELQERVERRRQDREDEKTQGDITGD